MFLVLRTITADKNMAQGASGKRDCWTFERRAAAHFTHEKQATPITGGSGLLLPLYAQRQQDRSSCPGFLLLDSPKVWMISGGSGRGRPVRLAIQTQTVSAVTICLPVPVCRIA
jgi:hypothetical protein